ncbi:hypothetical protein CVS40_9694 [Lucilia cuprina]|nr:hypothetical protein CVS40_9694 [Lucilia cuprina]
MSGQHPNYTQHLSANCPRGGRTYSSAGRPFTPADLKPCPLQSSYERSNRSLYFPNADDTTQDICPNMSSKEYSGRAFDPCLDISGNRTERSKQPFQHKQGTQRGSRLNLEYEMARNKDIALGCLRAEQAAACPRPPHHYERQAIASSKPQMAASARGRPFDLRAEIQRQLTEAESPNVCVKPGRGNINMGRPVDVDRACTPAGRSGRALDLQRDLTFRRLNLPTPKQQKRAISCPTPVQYSSPNSTAQHLPRICPRPSQSVCVSPTRSISPSEGTVSRYSTPINDSSIRSPRRVVKYPVTPVCRPLRTPICPVGEEAAESPGNITKTIMTTTTTTRPLNPQHNPISLTPQKSTTTELYENQTSRRRARNISNITQDNTRQLDSGYGQTPPRNFASQTPYKTPEQQLNITEQTTSASFQKTSSPSIMRDNITQMESMRNVESMDSKAKTFLNKTQTVPPPPPLPPLDPNNTNCQNLQRTYRSGDQSTRCPAPTSSTARSFDQTGYYNNGNCLMEEDYRPLPSRTCPSPIQTQRSQYCPAPTNESYYYNASMFAEPSQFHKRQCEYIDLTDETQYFGDDMDISGPELLSRSACPIKCEDSSQMQSWRIPPEDLTCCERTGYETFQNQQPDLSSTMVQTMPSQQSEIMGADFEATEYQELPMSLKPQAPTCPPCEQPKASLFRCLAKKLSSTYDFISSLIAPQKSAITVPMDQTTGQVCDTTTFGLNTMFNTSGRHNATTTFDLGNLYATQCNNDTTNFGLNSLFGNKTQLGDEPSSLRECANAKRCGRVQFDSSDKSQVQDPHRTAIRKAEIENLVNDTYCPGIIQETIDGRENFNNYSFNMSLVQEPKDATVCEGPPKEDPMTLLEAFSIRIEKERIEINKDLNETSTVGEIEASLHKYFASQNPSDLNRSIKSLLLSEHLQEHEQEEKSKGSSFEAEVQKLVTTFPDNAQIKLIAYTGHTNAVKEATYET